MTSFCMQCGNQVREGGKFCQSCGAPSSPSTPQGSQHNPSGAQPGQAAGGAYSSVYASSTPSSYQGGQAGQGGYPGSFPAQPHGQAPFGTPQRSGRTLKIILITLFVLLVLIGGTVVVVTYVVRRAVNNIVQVSDGKDGQPETVLNIPGGPRISAGGGVTEEQLGVPIYPGATALKDGGSVSISGSTAEGQGWIGAATFETDDALDEVVSFYREKLGEDASKIESTQDGKRTAMFTLQSPKGWRMVTIGEEDGEAKTKIAITGISGRSVR